MKRLILSFLASAVGGTAGAEMHRDLEYGRAGGERLLLDACAPEGPGVFPVAILIHGGGWSRGDKAGSDRPGDAADITPWFTTLTDAKFTWFSINYRLLPQHAWPAGFEDVQTAIRWVRAHAHEFKGDPERIALFGHSAGGNLVALAATNLTRETRAQAAVLFAPSSDDPVEKGRPSRLIPALQDAARPPADMSPEAVAVARHPWPIDHVNAFMPPVLVVQGDSDKTVPLERSLAFLAKVRDAGVPDELITLKGAPHSLIEGLKVDPSYPSKMIAWLHRTFAAAPITPPSKSQVTVSADGTGQFTSVQAALDAIPSDNRERRIVFVREGTYRERIRVNRPFVTLRGESRRRTRIESPAEPAPSPRSSGRDAVITIDATDCVVENLSIENHAGTGGDRAVAIHNLGDRVAITDCDVHSAGRGTITLGNPVGRTYLARLNVRGAGECVFAEGRCFMTDAIIHTVASDAIGMLGRGASHPEQIFVLRNSRLDGSDGWHLYRQSHNPGGRAFLINCRFAGSLAGPGELQTNTVFFHNTHRLGGDFPWHADSLAGATDLSSAAALTTHWTFRGQWEPTGTRRQPD